MAHFKMVKKNFKHTHTKGLSVGLSLSLSLKIRNVPIFHQILSPGSLQFSYKT